MAPRLRRGVLISIEGGEGSGKSTLARELERLLREHSYDPLLTHEPAGTPLGSAVQEILDRAASTGAALAPVAELLLFEAARAQHVAAVIRPAIESGRVVLCDRYTDSTLAYQGYGRGLSLDHIRACNHIATEGLAPQLTLLLDIEPEAGLARAGRRAQDGVAGMAAIGGDSLEFHRRVREGFLALADKERGRIARISGILPASAVVQTAWERIRGMLERHL